LAANLASGELAINITDGKLFYKDNANAVQVIGWKVVPATAGGTGQTSYAVGDLLYADTTTSLAKLADVATGNALISGGVNTAPSWGKIGLTTHVSGVLPVANGGTNASTASITSFNNITGYSASGATGTTTTNLVFSTNPSITTPTLVGDVTVSTGNVSIGTSGKGVTTGSSIPLGFGTNGSTTQATIDTSGNFFAASASGTTRNGNFSNGGQLAALATNSTVRSFNSIYRHSATNNATVDVWIGRDAGGNVFGNSILVGHFYVYVNGASGANGFAGVYAVQTTGDGTTAATLTAVSSVTRGTSPVSSVQIANDGSSGAVKLTITYINNSGVVTGGGSTVTFFGQIA
jgi:hypothetical protein